MSLSRRAVLGLAVGTLVADRVATGLVDTVPGAPGGGSSGTVAGAGSTAEPEPLQAAPAPAGPAVRPHLHTEALPRTGTGVIAAAHTTPAFSMLAITWSDPQATLERALTVRTRSVAGGAWHTWTLDATLETASQDATAAGRGGTVPLWVGPSDGVELRSSGRASADLPVGLRLDLIDPGPSSHAAATDRTTSSDVAKATSAIASVAGPTTSPTLPARSATASATASPSPSVAITTPSPASTSTVPAPSIVSRAGWQADESLRRAAPLYADVVSVVFVHHTDTANGYAPSDVPAIIRSLYAYHVLSLGWNDIGYNFLVDAYGTVYEGRYGGIDRPVLGAQTYGFNVDSAGVAVIGTYSSAAPSTAVLDSLGQLTAWKLALSGTSPTGRAPLVEGADDSYGFTGGRTYTFDTISGHRDGYATECPGDALYARLPQIRTLAATVTARAPRPSGIELTTLRGAADVGGQWYAAGTVHLGWTSTLDPTQVGGYQVLVDGQPVVSVPPSARSAYVTLPKGRHTVGIRAVPGPVSSAAPAPVSTSSAAASPSPSAAGVTSGLLTVLCDPAPPSFPVTPSVVLRPGTVAAAGTPVRLTWRAADDLLLTKVVATTPSTATFAPGTTTWDTVAGPGRTTFTLTAHDAAGNTRTATASGAVTHLPASSATLSGIWSGVRSTSYLDGSALASSQPAATMTWTFTGSSVTWIAERTPTSGQARIILDGATVTTVDLVAARPASCQAVWVHGGLAAGRHTLTVTVVGTPGRPTVTTEGILTWTQLP